jgi:hypothetical protein
MPTCATWRNLADFLGLDADSNPFPRAGHYNRALEEAIQTHKSQWAKDWESRNPLAGGATFASMSPTQRVSIRSVLLDLNFY